MNRLFVVNLPFSLTEENLQELFGRFGRVISVKMPTDRDTGRKRGFAFVEMDGQQAASKAIFGLNKRAVEGRTIGVELAKPKAA